MEDNVSHYVLWKDTHGPYYPNPPSEWPIRCGAQICPQINTKRAELFWSPLADAHLPPPNGAPKLYQLAP